MSELTVAGVVAGVNYLEISAQVADIKVDQVHRAPGVAGESAFVACGVENDLRAVLRVDVQVFGTGELMGADALNAQFFGAEGEGVL